jgi:hypothetical protein
VALAYEANLTRVVTFMKSRDASQRVYPKIGVTEPHHAMSHHGNNPEKLQNLVKLNTTTWRSSRSSWTSWRPRRTATDAARSHRHPVWQRHERERHAQPLNIPTLLVGKGNGLLKGNQHIAAPKDTPMANFLLDMVNKFGSDDEDVRHQHGRFEGVGRSSGRTGR